MTKYILAGSIGEAKYIASKLQLKDWAYISSSDSILGKDNLHVLLYGSYASLPHLREIKEVLATRKNVLMEDLRDPPVTW